MAFMLVGKDAFDAELLSAGVAESLNRLQCRGMTLAELLDYALLIDERLVRLDR